MSLRIRRGTEADRTSKVFDLGELIWTTNGQKLYVGDGLTTGGIDIAAQLAGTGLHYNTSTGKLDAVLSGLTTDAVPQGSNNKYFTAQLAQTAVAAALTAGNSYNSHIQFTYDDVNDRITAAVALDGIGLTAISQDATPSLGGNLTLNSHNITGTGSINTIGGLTVSNETNASFKFSSLAGQTADFGGITDGTQNGFASIGIDVSKGTVAAPTNTAAGDILGSFSIRGYYNGQTLPAVALLGGWAAGADLTQSSPSSQFVVVTGKNTGVNVLIFDEAGVLNAPAVRVEDGSASRPSFGFTTDGSFDTGFFHPGDGIMGISVNGVETGRIDSGGIRTTGFMKVGSFNGVLPAPAEAGMIVLDTGSGQFKGYNGSNWVVLG
jgi:hypothetical protein